MGILLSRRMALASGAAALALASTAAAQQATRLRMYWWGSKERADRTLKAAELFKRANPNVTLDGETLGWGDYWPRLATQAAGRNLPDIIQMDYRYLFEYARRGALLPLDSYLGKGLDIEDFGKANLDSCRVDGKLYGVNLGVNSSAVLYTKNVFESAGIRPPTHETDWNEFARIAAELTKAAKRDGFYGTQDGGGVEPAFEGWLRMRGQDLYTKDDKLGFGESEAAEWFAMWDDMRKAKACPPADVQALDKQTPETGMITLNKAAIVFAHSNQLTAYQALTQHPLGMTMYPTVGASSKFGHYLKPSQMFSIAASTKNPAEAIKFVDFCVRDPAGVGALSVERGVPASARTRALVSADLDALGKAMVEYIALVSTRVGDLPPPPPKGAGEIQTLLRRINEEVGFAKAKVPDAAKRFVAEAKSILARG